jgi:putative heme transporter
VALLTKVTPPVATRNRRRGWQAASSATLAAVLIGIALPRIVGATWSEIGHLFTALGPLHLCALAAVWLAGLWVHTVALTAAMPGLTSRRALFLNLTGSAVSDVLPLGGAAGSALNYSTSRSWGFSTPAFLRWALVTNIWDTLGRRRLDGVVARAGREPPPNGGYAARIVDFRRDCAGLIATAWVRLSLGKAGYALLQALLLWMCLLWLGGVLRPAVVFAVFAAERVLSLAVVTPGATGVVEIGMTGMLVAFGVDPATAAAGVLL